MDVYVLGTDHRLQTADGRATSAQIDQFRVFLREVCANHSIAAIAEEMCLEGLQQFSLQESVCFQEAKHLRLSHSYCDPDTEERTPLGIQKKSELEMEVFFGRLAADDLAGAISREYAKREEVWLNRLRVLDTWPVLFVCGADHSHSFTELVRRSGRDADIVAADWSPNPPLQPAGCAGG